MSETTTETTRTDPPPGRRKWPALAVILGALAPNATGLPGVIYLPLLLAAVLVALRLAWPRPAGAWAAASVLVIISAGLALSAADLILRMTLSDQLYYRPHERFAGRWPSNPKLVRYSPGIVYDGDVFGGLAAMLADPPVRQMRNIRFETDALGFRNKATALAANPNLIILGDSFAAGSGNSQEQRLGSQLAKRYGYRTYTLAIPGNSPWRDLMNLKLNLDVLAPAPGSTVLLLMFSGNDLDDKYYPELDPPAPNGLLKRTLVQWQSFRRRSPVRRLLKRVGKSDQKVDARPLPDGEPMLYFSLYTRRAARRLEEVRRHPNFPSLSAVFAEFARLSKARQLRFKVAVAPSKYEIYRWLYEGTKPRDSYGAASGFTQAVAALATQNNVAFLDLAPGLYTEALRRWRNSGELLWWRDDSHWNPAGHEVAAELIQKRLLN